MKPKVAIVTGGYSKEAEIAVKSADTILKYLDRDLYEPYLIHIQPGEWMAKVGTENIPIDKNDFSFLYRDERINFDAAFIMLHGTPGEDGKLQGYFDMIELPYSTGDSHNMSLTFNKYQTTSLLKQLGFTTADSVLLNSREDFQSIVRSDISFPCFVKPNAHGSSIGISKVMEEQELEGAVEEAFEVGAQIMIEKAIEGREITCGVVVLNGNLHVLPVTEIISERNYFDYQAKYIDKETQEITPANIDQKAYVACQKTTEEIYKKLNCSGIIRVDYILKDDQLFVIEVNTVPGFSEMSIVPKQIKAAGLDIGTCITESLMQAINAKEKKPV